MEWRYQNLIEAIEAAVQETAPQRGYTFLDGAEAKHLTFAALWQQAVIYAGALQQRGVQKGDRVLVLVPTSAEFASVYLALLLCGAAPCVLPTPDNIGNQAEATRRVLHVTAQLSARLLLTTEELDLLSSEIEDELEICPVATLQAEPVLAWQPVLVTGDDLALIQASSGTTGAPKCIALTHSNILANLQQIGQHLQVVDEDVVVCWLPLFHDMGLIGCFLFVLYWQLHGVFMTPYRFIRRPATWLKAISDYGGTLSPAPNFAYALATRRTTAEELALLDLSTWRAAMCGAEQIDVGTLHRFAERFTTCGFRPNSLVPCYGLAEASFCVVMHHPDQPFKYERIVRSTLVSQGIAVAAAEADTVDTTLICDCGPAVEDTRIVITNEAGQTLPEGHVGQVWINGPSITLGYYHLPEENQRVLRNGWLNTGDLGYLRHGHLFITGRSKDLIVVRGQNYQPTEFEWAAAEVPGVALGRVVAFGVYDPQEATEQIYLVCERPRTMEVEEKELCETIKRHVGQQTGIMPASVGLIPRNTIPKTTTGKLQRARTKSLYFKLNPKEIVST